MINNVKKLQMQNNKLDKRINSENREIFTNIICYIRGADISDYDQEVVRRDLTEMILAAQERGENIHSVINDDFKEFCDNVIDNFQPKTIKEKLIDYADIFCIILSIYGTVNILFLSNFHIIIQGIMGKDTVNYDIEITLGTLTTIVFILTLIFIIIEIITKKSLNNWSRNTRILLGGLAGVGIMTVFFIINIFGKAVAFSINIYLVIAILITLFILHRILSKL